jgi:hypothetical protein
MSPLFVPLKQTTIHVPDTGPAHDPSRGHLFFVLTSPSAEQDVLCVSSSRAYPKCDRTCVLETGCHDFIRQESFILYAKPEIYRVKLICDRVRDGDVTYKGLISEDIFERICDGLLDSPHTPPYARDYFNRNATN